jgi:folate-binding protein YgfZ
MAEPTEAQLKKFAMFSKVTLQRPEGPDATRAVIVGGREASDWLREQGANPGAPMQLCGNPSNVRVAMLDTEQRLFLLLATANDLKTLLDKLPSHAILAQQTGWWQCLTALGQAHVIATTQEEFIPQELNYDLNQGISFKKGCYKGQEIIARLHFKGTPKFRTLRFACQSAMPLQAGTHVNDMNGARLGQIAQVARTGEQSYELLVVTKPDAIATGASVVTDTGITLQLTRLPLPYALP